MMLSRDTREHGNAPTDTRDAIAARLVQLCARKMDRDAPRVALEGQLIRPMLAVGAADAAIVETDEFWCGVLAVQLAHEASLAHDDVVDGAALRRGAPTMFANAGVAGALLEGDHLLTMAFRMAAATRSQLFIECFATAVERTVAGEKLQGRSLGEAIDAATCERIAAGKAGELMACALATGSLIRSSSQSRVLLELGREIGVVYQMLDDLLDYCRAAETGKSPLGDYAQQRWTWILAHIPGAHFGMPTGALLAALHEPRAEWVGTSAFDRICDCFGVRVQTLREQCASLLGAATCVDSMLASWGARMAAARETERRDRSDLVRQAIQRQASNAMGGERDYTAFLDRNSVSFRFASRLLPEAEFGRIVRVYAFCRLTDDIVDEPAVESGGDAATESPGPAEMLRGWLELARAAYGGAASGVSVIDDAMQEMAAASVPFAYVQELARAMRMDLDGTSYETLADLKRYTYGAAGVVGLWIARLGGVSDPRALTNAERMGHAMQLTNIVRDVGEDWLRGRRYIPSDVMQRHGILADDINAMLSGQRPISKAYRDMLEELITIADQYYRDAFEWIPVLPVALQRSMAVAARVYGGIHNAVRANGYDNLRQRAHTSLPVKVRLAIGALVSLRTAVKFGPPSSSAFVSDTLLELSNGHG